MALATLHELRKLLQDDFYEMDIVRKTKKKHPQLPRLSDLSANWEDVIQRFESLGLRFPKTRLSAEEAIQKIMETQWRVLKAIHDGATAICLTFYSSTELSQFFLRAIWRSDVRNLITRIYIGKRNVNTFPILGG